jgi:tripartite-type tricarboxylate transporter receptor subunit TctC
MHPAIRHALIVGAFALALHIDATAALDAAPAFPTKSVRMVVPLAPGGGSDIVGRIVAQALTERWGQSVVVDNRPGAGSAVGTSIAAKAPADGYTTLVSSSSIAISPALYKRLDFDVNRDFAPVTLIASQPSMLVVHPSVAANSVRELVALAQAHPAKLAYASAGAGSATHLGTELLLYASKTKMLHVPYKSAGRATSAVLAGEVQVLLTNMASVLPYIASGKLKAMGISSLARSKVAPQVPTLSESGLPGFEYATWYGMLVPARTQPALVDYMHASVAHVLKTPQVAERFTAQGLQPFASAPADFDRYLKAEVERWRKVVSAADIRME